MEKSLVLSALLCALALAPTTVHSQGQSSSSCVNPAGNRGECIGIRDCGPILDLLQSQPLLPETRAFLVQSRCGTQGRDPMVCCVRQTVVNTPRTVPPGNDNTNADYTRTGDNVEYNLSNNPLLPTDCGKDLRQRIFGGNRTGLDEFPWMALLEYTTTTGDVKTSCGGVLISKRYVLTAAHCLVSEQLQTRGLRLTGVRLGEFNVLTNPDCIQDDEDTICADEPISVGIEEQIVHENYNQYSLHQYNDIALLRLDRDVQTTAYIKPICLPSTASLTEKLYVSGWGRTETGYASAVKLKLSVPLFDRDRCAEVYYANARVRLGYGQFCAGGELNKDSCSGDSGGPLMAFRRRADGNGRWTCVGVVSLGPSECGTQGYPGVYTRVIDFIPWILGKLRQ